MRIKRGGIPVPDIYAERFCMIIRWKNGENRMATSKLSSARKNGRF